MLNRFQCEIRTDNAAFEDDAYEVARMLRAIADKLDAGTRGGPLHDANGNRVGRFDLEREDD